MALEQLEPLLYLPDDTSFYPDVGDEFHTTRLVGRSAALVGLVFFTYILAIFFGSFIWQDDWHVSRNILLWSWTGLARTWAHGLGGSYHPVPQTLLWIEHHFGGQSPIPYHLISALLHGGNCILLWMVLRRLGMRGAWLAAALFALHPVQVQTVAWVSQQSHLICAGLCLGSAWAFLRLNRIRPAMPAEMLPADVTDVDQLLDPEPVGILYCVSIGLAALATLSDTAAIVLPLALLVLVWWKRGVVAKDIWLQLLPFLVIAALGAALAVWVGIGTPELGGIAPVLSPLQRLLVTSRAIWAYLLAIVWPYPLLFVYPRWSVLPGDGLQFIYPAAVVVSLAVAWAGKRLWGRAPLAAMLLFLLLLLPAVWLILSSSAPPIFVADHLQYFAAAVPLAAIAWAVVGPISLIPSPIVLRSIRAGVGAACLIPLAVLVVLQTQDYSSPEGVWKATLAQAPGATVARVQYAMSLLHGGKPMDAADVLGDAPTGTKDAAMLAAWGQVFAAKNRYADAVDSFRDALKLNPGNNELTFGLANALFRSGRVDDALEIYRNELNRTPNDDGIYNAMGQIFVSEGKPQQAIEMFEQALRVNPRSIPVRISYANVLFQTRRPSEAAQQLQQVVAIDPSYFATFVVASAMELQIKDYAGAEENCRIALRLNPKSAEAWNNLGVAQCNMGHVREAIISFQQAIQHRPDYEEAKRNLELARRSLVS